MNFRKQKGVTLIALVVTVIVLLILAGVSITTLFDQDDKDLISKTYSTKELAETSQDLEQDKLDDLYGYGIYPPDDEVLAPDTEVTEPEEDPLPEVTEPEVTPSGNIIPEGGQYTQADGTVLGPGDSFPDIVTTDDTYTYGDYKYTYSDSYSYDYWLASSPGTKKVVTYSGWRARVVSSTKTSYGALLSEINGEKLTNLGGTFSGCTKLITSPTIPGTVKYMDSAFYGCTSLKVTPTIPNTVTYLHSAFRACTGLTTITNIPSSAVILTQCFSGDTAVTCLNNSITIPNTVSNMNGMFDGCSAFAGTIYMNMSSGYIYFLRLFNGSVDLSGVTMIGSNETFIKNISEGGTNLDSLTIIVN